MIGTRWFNLATVDWQVQVYAESAQIVQIIVREKPIDLFETYFFLTDFGRLYFFISIANNLRYSADSRLFYIDATYQ